MSFVCYENDTDYISIDYVLDSGNIDFIQQSEMTLVRINDSPQKSFLELIEEEHNALIEYRSAIDLLHKSRISKDELAKKEVRYYKAKNALSSYINSNSGLAF